MTAFFCPACDHPVPEFAPGPGGRPKARCPLCQALERHRMLLLILRAHGYLFIPPARVLDIAPARPVRHFLEPKLGSRYVATDLLNPLGISIKSDLTKLGFADGSFDVIICYHVLEHIPDDGAAIAELTRVLRPGGLAFIQVPRRRGAETEEDPSASVEERIRRFGQDDHVRMYGDDLEHRLIAGGLVPSTVRPAAGWPDADVARFGLQRAEEIWICRQGDGRSVSGGSGSDVWFPAGFNAPTTSAGLWRSTRRAVGRTPFGRVARKILRATRKAR